MLNRTALIVRPAAPFIAWAESVDPEGVAPVPDQEQTVYLLPEHDPKDADAILELVFGEVFERELEGWHRLESNWPRKRTLPMFREWFAIELHSVIEDLCADPLQDDDDDFTEVVVNKL